jgi:small nuclear ribonucleoprotein (snRNP)-like protein
MSQIYDLSERVAESLMLEDPPTAAPHPSQPSPLTPTMAVSTPALDKLRSLLRQTMRITITDGRVFLGTFAGTDRLLNVLLINTDEFRLPSASSAGSRHAYNPNPNGRYVGLVLIPWRLVVRVEAPKSSGGRDGLVDPDPGVGLRGIVDRYDEVDGELYT